MTAIRQRRAPRGHRPAVGEECGRQQQDAEIEQRQLCSQGMPAIAETLLTHVTVWSIREVVPSERDRRSRQVTERRRRDRGEGMLDQRL
ncbi:hypothetical protein AB0M45_13485 [Nocardia sp. NPDC051787]|uniref:hypothetical protein n=1 Tax=Nocardia sp. NPDC051787 TaxID=3155415 RepID=UPI003426E49A